MSKHTVQKWLDTSRTNEGIILEDMRKKALDVARPDATLDIARDLATMVYARKKIGGAVTKEAAAAA